MSYSRGKLRSDDEGDIEMGVTVDADCVVIAFRKPIAWIGMPAEMAEQLATTLLSRAAEARKNRQ